MEEHSEGEVKEKRLWTACLEELQPTSCQALCSLNAATPIALVECYLSGESGLATK